MKKKNFNKEIDETLNSLDGIQAADPGPYFYSRLRARMENQTEPISTRPSLALLKVAVALLLIINLASITFLGFDSNANSSEDVMAGSDYFTEQTVYSFSSEYLEDEE